MPTEDFIIVDDFPGCAHVFNLKSEICAVCGISKEQLKEAQDRVLRWFEAEHERRRAR